MQKDKPDPLFNTHFSFVNLSMNRYELEQYNIIFEVMQYERWAQHETIGIHKVGLSTLYRATDH